MIDAPRAGRKAAAAVITATMAVLALITLSVFSVAAHAADKGGPIFDDGPVVKKAKWSGLWIGAIGSYDTQSTQLGGVATFDDKAMGYGLAVGADHRFANTNVVAGVSVDYMKHNTGTPLQAMDGAWSMTGRLGFVIGETTLAYALAGYTWESTSGPLSTLNLDKGITLGLGVETYVTQHITIKGEYRWVDEGTAAGGAVEQTSQAVRASVNWRF